jgi:hypothetical protein
LMVADGVRDDGSRRVTPENVSLRGASDSVRGATDRGAIESDDVDRDGEGADCTDGACRGASTRGAADREDADGADGADCGAGADAWPPPPLGTRAPADRCCANATDVVKTVIAKTEMAARIPDEGATPLPAADALFCRYFKPLCGTGAARRDVCPRGSSVEHSERGQSPHILNDCDPRHDDSCRTP